MALLLQSSELWTLQNGPDAVRCVAMQHPMGVEVRYVVNEQPLMARVLPDWGDVEGVAATWRERLEARGWVASGRRHRRH